jgi:hypothetical protein
MDLKYTLRSVGVPIDGTAWMFGDKWSVLSSCTILHYSLKKRRNALSYHRVREAIASKVMYFLHVPGVSKPDNVFMKALQRIRFSPLVQPLLFWNGGTVKVVWTDPIEDIIRADKLQKAAATGPMGVTRGNPVPVVPVT